MSFINLLRTRSGSISQGGMYNAKIVETSILVDIINIMKENGDFPSDADITFKEGYYLNQRRIVDANTNTDMQYVLSDGFTMGILLSCINCRVKCYQYMNDDGTTGWTVALDDVFNYINISEEDISTVQSTLQSMLRMVLTQNNPALLETIGVFDDILILERFDKGSVEENYSQTFNVNLKRNDTQVVISSPVTVEYSKDSNSQGSVMLREHSDYNSEIKEYDYLPFFEGAANSTFNMEVKIDAA